MWWGPAPPPAVGLLFQGWGEGPGSWRKADMQNAGARVLDAEPCITVLKMLLKVRVTVVTGHRGGEWQRSRVTEVGGGRVQFGHGSGACSPAWTDPHSRAATRRGRGDLCGLAGGMEEAWAEASGVVVPSRSTDETQGASPPFLSSVVRPAREYQTWLRSRAWGGCPQQLSAWISGFGVVFVLSLSSRVSGPRTPGHSCGYKLA